MLVVALAGLAVVGFVAATVVAGAFPVKPYRIPSESMEPTIEAGERVLVERVSIARSDPRRGDIVVFHAPVGADLNTCAVEPRPGQPCPRPGRERSETEFVKRIVGEPGDRLSVRGGRVHIDGEPQNEGYARLNESCASCNLEEEVVIPPDHYFMMGDNRGFSADSREWGPVPGDWIVGHVFATYWPPGRVQGR